MHFLLADIEWLIMRKKVRIIKQFKLSMNSYKDKKHPCYNCLVKGICTNKCNDFNIYCEYITTIGEEILTILHKPNLILSHPFPNVMDMISSIKFNLFLKIIKNRKMNLFLKMANYHQRREDFIINNHSTKYGYDGSSTSSSSISASHCSTKKNNILSTTN